MSVKQSICRGISALLVLTKEWLSVFALAAILTILAVPSRSATQYRMDVIDTLGGNFGRARAINLDGVAVGESYTSANVEHAFLWQNGGVEDLGTLGGLRSRAMDINSSGKVAGWASDSSGASKPVLWDSAETYELPTLGGTSGSAWGLNDSGDAVGNAFVNQSIYHAALWHGGTATDLGTLGGSYSIAYDINNNGTIVGGAHDSNGKQRASLWQGSDPIDLSGLSGGSWDTARAVNDNNQVILWGKPTGASRNHAALWTIGNNDSVIDIGTFGGAESWAYGLNNQGLVVGWAELAMGNYHAFVYDGFEMTDLGTLGGLFSSAYGINDAGIVVGWALDSNGVTQAVQWTPVPEPTGVLSLVIGLALSGSLLIKRKIC